MLKRFEIHIHCYYPSGLTMITMWTPIEGDIHHMCILSINILLSCYYLYDLHTDNNMFIIYIIIHNAYILLISITTILLLFYIIYLLTIHGLLLSLFKDSNQIFYCITLLLMINASQNLRRYTSILPCDLRFRISQTNFCMVSRSRTCFPTWWAFATPSILFHAFACQIFNEFLV